MPNVYCYGRSQCNNIMWRNVKHTLPQGRVLYSQRPAEQHLRCLETPAYIHCADQSSPANISDQICSIKLATKTDKSLHYTTLHYMHACTHTHTHNRFMALLDYVWDYPGEPAPGRWNQSGFTGARDSVWQWHQIGHMQICTLTQTHNHASTQFFTGRMPFLPPN